MADGRGRQRPVAVPFHGDGGRLRPGGAEPGRPGRADRARVQRVDRAGHRSPRRHGLGRRQRHRDRRAHQRRRGRAQFVERFGGGMHSIALQVEDLEATMAHLEEQEVHIAARPRPEMCFTDPRDAGGCSCSGAPSSSPRRSPLRRHGARTDNSSPSWHRRPARLRRRAGRRPRRLGRAFARCSAPRSRSSTPTLRPANPWRACHSATARSPSSGCPRRGPGRSGAAPTSGRAPTWWRCASTTLTRPPTRGRRRRGGAPPGRRPRRLGPCRHRRRAGGPHGRCSRATRRPDNETPRDRTRHEPARLGLMPGVDLLEPHQDRPGHQVVVEIQWRALALARPDHDLDSQHLARDEVEVRGQRVEAHEVQPDPVGDLEPARLAQVLDQTHDVAGQSPAGAARRRAPGPARRPRLPRGRPRNPAGGRTRSVTSSGDELDRLAAEADGDRVARLEGVGRRRRCRAPPGRAEHPAPACPSGVRAC